MAVSFMGEEQERQLRLASAMSDEELISHGRALKRLAVKPNRNLPAPESFVKQLREAREEWRRRHPKTD